ncbi:hypothetical protein BMI86_05865 [Thioclava sp. DLFJ5-1]|uniref:hypothetical protein n=1 Tax=Thioclava sp. DLFJ5-1 TaxID=1915314 RepID=UPI000997D9FA|nr:hypothetical protein [Thioclava sp. DLFJ5-1]OOY22052.1 hypothetical protein BMI86_05865 [Thioclava sp. DLFJ5-1]
MATFPTITRHLQNEDGSDTPGTSILTLFPQFLDALEDFVDYETWLDEAYSWNPAFHDNLRLSEAAQEQMLHCQEIILALRPNSPVEKPIKLAVFGIKLAMLNEDDDRRVRFRDIFRRRRENLRVKGGSVTDIQANRLLTRALPLFERFLELDMFDPVEALAPPTSG